MTFIWLGVITICSMVGTPETISFSPINGWAMWFMLAMGFDFAFTRELK